MADDNMNEIRLQFREEVLELTKQWKQYAEIRWHKEVLKEEQQLVIPIFREELVIEKKFLDPKFPEQALRTEIVRIPIKEERIEVRKHTFNLEKVEINKQPVQQMQSVDLSLKKEVLFINITGKPIVKIIDI